MNDPLAEAEELRFRLVFYRHAKVCAAFLRERLEEQPYLPGAKRKPLPPNRPSAQLTIFQDER